MIAVALDVRGDVEIRANKNEYPTLFVTDLAGSSAMNRCSLISEDDGSA